MAALGFDPEDFDDDESEIEIWECNADAFNVFEAMGSQWRAGMAGATGLDYAVLPVVMDMVGVDKDSRTEVFSSVRIMENAALEQMAENRDDG